MKQIKIKYYPIKRLNLAFTAKGQQPESWAEVNPQQIIAIACTANGAISDIAFLAAMTGLKKWVIKRLDAYQRFQLAEALEFFNVAHLHNAFVIPHIEIAGEKLYTPKPKLKGMTFGQFIFVDTYCGLFQDEEDPAHLHNFLAALCLPNRKHFDDDEIELRANDMKYLAPELKEALLLNYLLIKQWLIKTYPLLFPEPEEEEEEPAETDEPKPKAKFDSNSWIKIYEGLVGDDLVNRDKYAALPVHETLRYLTKKIKENLKRKK